MSRHDSWANAAGPARNTADTRNEPIRVRARMGPPFARPWIHRLAPNDLCANAQRSSVLLLGGGDGLLDLPFQGDRRRLVGDPHVADGAIGSDGHHSALGDTPDPVVRS